MSSGAKRGLLASTGEKGKHPVFVMPPLAISRELHKKPLCGCIPGWLVMWTVPFFLAGCAFLLQNFQLRIGTYHYVHKMLQYDLVRNKTMNYTEYANYTKYIPLTIGETPHNVSFGSLDDPATSSLGAYQKVNIKVLDMLAALFPFLFVVLCVAMDKPMVLARIMLCFIILAAGKGLFAWITVVPDSNGWQACKARLAPGSYPVEWYAQEHTVLEILRMDPRSRLCADMMWSGHTYFVAIFAFGLHECVRRAMCSASATKRILVESLVASAAILQQTIEIYFVLKSRFHYTSDVVMAIFVTYLLFTNSTVAVVANWWARPGKDELKALHERLSKDKHATESKWLQNGLKSEGSISLGCCCCSMSRQFIYSPKDIHDIVDDIELATKHLKHGDPLKMDDETKGFLTDMMGMLHKDSLGCGEGDMCGAGMTDCGWEDDESESAEENFD